MDFSFNFSPERFTDAIGELKFKRENKIDMVTDAVAHVFSMQESLQENLLSSPTPMEAMVNIPGELASSTGIANTVIKTEVIDPTDDEDEDETAPILPFRPVGPAPVIPTAPETPAAEVVTPARPTQISSYEAEARRLLDEALSGIDSTEIAKKFEAANKQSNRDLGSVL